MARDQTPLLNIVQSHDSRGPEVVAVTLYRILILRYAPTVTRDTTNSCVLLLWCPSVCVWGGGGVDGLTHSRHEGKGLL